nr:PQQ-dependent sugar dehydrogenase [Oceanococcus sp. HetDA_MAG_MS8]
MNTFAANIARLAGAGLIFFFAGCDSTDVSAQQSDPSPPPTTPTPVPTTAIQRRSAPDTLRLTANTATGTTVNVREAFPALVFDRPVDMAPTPSEDQIAVVEHRGRVLIFDNRADVEFHSVFLNIEDRVLFDEAERGLVGIAFDPQYASNGFVYLSYAAGPEVDPVQCDDHCSVVSRFKRDPDDVSRLDPSSEEIILLLKQPGQFHNVGQLSFGPDGYLYIGLGDGFTWFGSGFSQNRTNLFGSILRIDVAQGLPYRIPGDNPFVGAGLEQAGVVGEGQPVREEIWAYGLRNPHRFSIDEVSRTMWVGDVGQDSFEEINQVIPGANYGWPSFEGTMPLEETDFGYDSNDLVMPVIQYGRDEGRSVTAGFVYRGSRLPHLFGHFLFGDFISGNLWSFDTRSSSPQHALVTDQAGGFSMVDFEAINDEPYFVNLGQGIVQTLDVDDSCSDDTCAAIPQKLSQTGIFSSLAPLKAQPGMIPYEVNTELWSDGAVKQRWFAIPEQRTIAYSSDGAWVFPEGSVLVKHFAMDLNLTDESNALTPLETRILLKRVDGWLGFSYAWNEEHTDAELLSGPLALQLAITTAEGPTQQTYDIPSRAECISCHNGSTGFALGLKTAQLNRSYDYPAQTMNQLLALSEVALLSPAPGAPDNLAVMPAIDDPDFTLEDRARAYLDANCASCHNPDVPLRSTIDLRYEVPLAETNLINQPATLDDFGIDEAKLVAPGVPENSVLLLRMQATDDRRMPPLASHVIHTDATQLIAQWVMSLPDTAP